MTYNWPFCDKCKKFVDQVDRHVDPFTDKIIYTIHCHGETATQVVAMPHDATLTSLV